MEYIFGSYCGGAPTIVFELPTNLGKSNLYLTILNGEILFNMFDEENRLELGNKKGNYLKNILMTLDNRDHILITSPDLLGYVAQQCYGFPNTWYKSRWKDDLSLLFWEHKIVVDEYHFYDPYTYVNLEKTLERLNIEKILLLSATKKEKYFKSARNLSTDELENEYSKDRVETYIASYPIEVNLVEDEMHINEYPNLETIYFFNSVVTAHETANDLRERGIELTEWTGIQKSGADKLHKLIIATSAAEVGLDLKLYEMHTQFWGFDWEVPSLIQRIGRIGRFKPEKPFKAYIYIEGTQAKLLRTIFDKNKCLTKDKFTEVLYETYGVPPFVPEDYVSYYLWDEEKKQELKMMWQIINDKISFYFRPPQSQAIFDWNDHKFLYNKFTIENQYHIELIKKITDMPFWKNFGLSEYKICQKKSNEERSWKRPYDGTLKPSDKSKKWFIFKPDIENII